MRGITLFALFTAIMTLSFMFTPLHSVLAADTAEDSVVIESTASAPSTVAVDDSEINVPDLMQDRVIGDVNAPVTVIEYASMTCMHCAHFHNTVYPTVKKELIDTGKVKFIFREFPLDGVALRASMMARCAPEDKFHSLLEVLFANQKRWVGAADPIDAMSKLGKLAGLSETRMKACLANTDLETKILETRQDATQTYKVNATPTFVFNNGAEVESGVLPANEFKKIVDTLTQ